MERADVVIVGGGFSGMCAAAALATGGRRVVALEARTGPDPRFRGELIHPPGVAALAALGLLGPLLRAGGAPVEGFAVVLTPEHPPIPLAYAEIEGGTPMGLAISHQDLVATLRREALARPRIELRTGERVVELLREGGRIEGVRTATGAEIRAPLTVVAEGRHSRLRRALGFEEETKLLSFTAALVAEGAELPRAGYGHVFLGTWGPILAYAIGPGRVRMCLDLPVGTEKGQKAVAAFLRAECAPSVPEPLRSAMLRALVREPIHGGAASGPTPRAPAEPIEICANHAVKTHRCTAPGVALVGDSGGCSHPLTAAGMTIALNDIRILAAELARGGPRPASIDPALVRYEARRYDYVRAREILAEGLYDVFRRGDDGARAMRGGLFRYWTSGPRARAASLSLLSGRESRLRAFVAEYLWVVGASAAGALGGATEAPEAGGRRALVAGLGRTAIEQLRRTTAHVYREVIGRRVAQPAAALSGAWRGAARRGASSGLEVGVEPARAEPGAEATAPSAAGLS